MLLISKKSQHIHSFPTQEGCRIEKTALFTAWPMKDSKIFHILYGKGKFYLVFNDLLTSYFKKIN